MDWLEENIFTQDISSYRELFHMGLTVVPYLLIFHSSLIQFILLSWMKYLSYHSYLKWYSSIPALVIVISPHLFFFSGFLFAFYRLIYLRVTGMDDGLNIKERIFYVSHQNMTPPAFHIWLLTSPVFDNIIS